MEDSIGLFALIFLAISPFVIAVMKRSRAPLYLEESKFKMEGSEITAFPRCYHCAWRG